MPDVHPVLAMLASMNFFYINPTDNRHKNFIKITKGQKHDDFSVFWYRSTE